MLRSQADKPLMMVARRWAALLVGCCMLTGGLASVAAQSANKPGETPVIAVLNAGTAPTGAETEKRAFRIQAISPRSLRLPSLGEMPGFVPAFKLTVGCAVFGSPPSERAPPKV